MSALDAVLRPPPGSDALPPFDRGWGDGRAPYLAYAEALDVNWSDDLEALHEESSRTHFIDVWTRRAILDGIAPAVSGRSVIADVGCSSGYLVEDLVHAHRDALVVGLDLVARGLVRAHADSPDVPFLLADATRLPIADGVLDAVVSANVLEHIADDGAVLQEIARVLRPGGRAAVVVPAGPNLYDVYDRFLSHERRYARGELAEKGRRAGLEVLTSTHLGWTLYPAFWAVKKRSRRRYADIGPEETRHVVEQQIASTNDSRLGRAACLLEQRLQARGVSVPFGIRSFVVFRRPVVTQP